MSTADPPIVMVPIDDIDVGDRLRKDLGDCTSLADSIDIVGLLHPIIVVRQSGACPLLLAAGARRLQAFRILNRPHVPARIYPGKYENLDEYVRVLDATENVERLSPGVLTMHDMMHILKEHLPKWREESLQATSGKGKHFHRGHTFVQDDGNRTTAKFSLASGMSVRNSSALIELYERAQGNRLRGDPDGWIPDLASMHIAQGLLDRVESGELSYQAARRGLRDFFPRARSTTHAAGKKDRSDDNRKPASLTFRRPLDASAADVLVSNCSNEEVTDFITALVARAPVELLQQWRTLVCGGA